jgi:hypothetical protein
MQNMNEMANAKEIIKDNLVAQNKKEFIGYINFSS